MVPQNKTQLLSNVLLIMENSHVQVLEILKADEDRIQVSIFFFSVFFLGGGTDIFQRSRKFVKYFSAKNFLCEIIIR